MSAGIIKAREWLEQEKEQGYGDPERAVLATATSQGVPHSRIVAIREISDEGFLFFTQRGTRKYAELSNPRASMTFWFAREQREIIIDGVVRALSQEENQHYWDTLSRERQLRFSVHTSGQPIDSLQDLEHRYQQLSKQYVNQTIPMSDFYCGFVLVPETFCFYTLGTQTFSEVIRYQKVGEHWEKNLVSP